MAVCVYGHFIRGASVIWRCVAYSVGNPVSLSTVDDRRISGLNFIIKKKKTISFYFGPKPLFRLS